MSELVFFDSHGQVVALKADDNDVLFRWNGTPVAILDDESVSDESGSVYAFDGRHLGWFGDGWIRDHDGACVYYTDDARGGPVRPARGRTRRARGTPKAPRARGARQLPPPHRPNQRAWSTLAVGSAFFDD